MQFNEYGQHIDTPSKTAMMSRDDVGEWLDMNDLDLDIDTLPLPWVEDDDGVERVMYSDLAEVVDLMEAI